MENSHGDNMRQLMGGMSAGGMGIDGQEDFDRPKVYYICGGKPFVYVIVIRLECGKEQPLESQVIRCCFCEHRIFYKKRERKLLQYEAR